jgi:hypothetical protein
MYDQVLWKNISEADDIEIKITLPLARAEKVKQALAKHFPKLALDNA